jgi:uncharacterized protein YutE (UPF0331/DUF86 family)
MSDELTDDDLSRILTAVETIETSLGILVEKRTLDRDGYKHDRETQAVLERRFVKMTDAAIDIGNVLLIHERGRPADSNPGTMKSLAESGILSEETAQANAARFRNVLAHSYGDIIDHDIVYDAAHDLDRYRQFLIAVRNHLDSINALDS